MRGGRTLPKKNGCGDLHRRSRFPASKIPFAPGQKDFISCRSSDSCLKRRILLPSQVSPMTGFPPTKEHLDTYSAGSRGDSHPIPFLHLHSRKRTVKPQERFSCRLSIHRYKRNVNPLPRQIWAAIPWRWRTAKRQQTSLPRRRSQTPEKLASHGSPFDRNTPDAIAQPR